MSKCPFWSTKKEKVNCYSDCPMYNIGDENDICLFKEFLPESSKISVAKNFNDDLFYSQDRYSNFDEDETVINY